MKLYDAIQQYAAADATAGDWTAVADTLNAPSVGQRITDLRTTRWVMTEFDDVVDQGTGATSADLILSVLQASTHPRVIAAYQSMNGGGIDISDPQVQAMINQIEASGAWSTELADRIRAYGFEQRTPAELAGMPGITAQQCEDHYTAEAEAEAGNVVFDKRRVLLCFNDGPVNDSLTLRITPIGVVNGVEVKGQSTNVGGVSTGLTGKDLQLFNDLQSLVDAYLES